VKIPPFPPPQDGGSQPRSFSRKKFRRGKMLKKTKKEPREMEGKRVK
jgi:hypothetical protein